MVDFQIIQKYQFNKILLQKQLLAYLLFTTNCWNSNVLKKLSLCAFISWGNMNMTNYKGH